MAKTKKSPLRAAGQTRPNFREFPELRDAKHMLALAMALGPAAFFFSASVIGFFYAVSHGGDAMYCTAFGVFAIIAFIFLRGKKQN